MEKTGISFSLKSEYKEITDEKLEKMMTVQLFMGMEDEPRWIQEKVKMIKKIWAQETAL